MNVLQSPAHPTSALPVFGSGRRKWLNVAVMLGADFIALSFTYWLTVFVRYAISPDYKLAAYLKLFPVIALFLAALYMQDLYPGFLIHPAEEIRRVSRAITIVLLLIASVTFLSRDAEAYSRSVFLIVWALGVPSVLLARLAARRTLSEMPWWGIPTVILGTGIAARRVGNSLSRNPRLGIRIVGFLGEPETSLVGEESPGAILGPLSMAPQLAATHRAQYAIVSMPEKTSAELNKIVQYCCHGFMEVLLMPDLVGAYSLGVTIKDVGGELGLEVPQRLFHRSSQTIKRCLDLVGSVFGLLLFSPLFVLFAILIRASSPGPVFYGHPRHGRSAGLFQAWKFRTMVVNGEQVLAEYFATRPEEQAYWNREHKLRDDPRVTPVGRFLRRASLDELPQLWNVLIGDMSIVGPRPIVPNEVEVYADRFELCTMVRPGITGLWQVSGRNNLTFQERIRFNEFYIRNWSVWLDLFILAKTVTTVLKGDGAY